MVIKKWFHDNDRLKLHTCLINLGNIISICETKEKSDCTENDVICDAEWFQFKWNYCIYTKSYKIHNLILDCFGMKINYCFQQLQKEGKKNCTINLKNRFIFYTNHIMYNVVPTIGRFLKCKYTSFIYKSK